MGKVKTKRRRMRQMALPHTDRPHLAAALYSYDVDTGEPIYRCKDCREPPIAGSRRCTGCRLAHAERERKRRRAIKKQRLCWRCRAPAAKGLTTCEPHRGTQWRKAKCSTI